MAHPCVDQPGPRPGGLGDDGHAGRRRSEFASREEVFARYGSRPPFNVWRAATLWDYVSAGFERTKAESAGSGVRLLCQPELEAEMNLVIGSAIGRNQVLEGTIDPFPALYRIRCPVLLTWGEKSGPGTGAWRRAPRERSRARRCRWCRRAAISCPCSYPRPWWGWCAPSTGATNRAGRGSRGRSARARRSLVGSSSALLARRGG